MKTLSFVVAALALTFTAHAAAAQKIDLTGEWAFEVQTEAGSGSPPLIFNTRANWAKPT